MKQCPQCRRAYYDLSMIFCLEDGTPLIESTSADQDPGIEAATAIFVNSPGVGKGPISSGSASELLTSEQSRKAESERSIAVLPFRNISQDDGNDYFSDGLTEEIISDLSKIRSLRVISRSSSMRLKGSTKDTKSMAQELNVRYILDGSVRKFGDNIRIATQLIDGINDANLWAEKYTGTLNDIFEIQENVSQAIVSALKVTLSSDEERRIEERPIADAQALDFYLRAKTELQRGVPEALSRSIELLQEGLAIVGENELLCAAIGYTYYSYFRWVSKVDGQYLRLANDYAQRAFALNPASSHGFALQGMIHVSEGNIVAAIRSMKQAVAIEPTNTEALLWLAIFSMWAGETDLAFKSVNKLRSIDPLLPIGIFITGFVHFYKGEFSEGQPWIRRAFEMDLDSPVAIWSFAVGLAWLGCYEECFRYVDELAERVPNWVYTHHGLFLKHALRGEKELALSYDTPELALEAKYDCHFALHVAHCFALIHENAKAVEYLELAVRLGMVNYPFLSQHDPLLENIRHEEAFKKLMDETRQLSERLMV